MPVVIEYKDVYWAISKGERGRHEKIMSWWELAIFSMVLCFIVHSVFRMGTVFSARVGYGCHLD